MLENVIYNYSATIMLKGFLMEQCNSKGLCFLWVCVHIGRYRQAQFQHHILSKKGPILHCAQQSYNSRSALGTEYGLQSRIVCN